MELFVDVRWLLDRQERVLGKDLQIRDYSALVAAVARHRVNTPHLDVGEPDAYWRAAALLDTIVLQRPLPARNELYGYGVAVAYIEASGETVTASEEQWIQLIEDIKALRLDTFDIADRLRSWRAP
ncbi:toxin Doc (plasmid) [Streptomyces sp. NBC_01340]|uniref:toxin Doc n=1 Tax=unclassified Streptomyces TaxID=2593676 RepID=UPI00225A6CE6|nr:MULTISPECIES: toxin Doc [unclassified Streptomyces]MCX4460083.1 toxin Doc [Streptomyces sp. NBC_01719]MCX4500586.1 toxin Doc [Streptomyces sp. NBC_01728]MCX4598483.1 toxin Doc [Streptomyces sp. NBC_01549]WSI45733.1 toxin Doc [Streptomyces sp. NBC_01340]